MDSHVFRKAANRLPAMADVAVLRFNTRGTESPHGRSEGSFAEGDDERFDVEAAVEFVRERELPNVWIVGWSFGTDLALRHGLLDGVVARSCYRRRCARRPPRISIDGRPDGRPLVALIPNSTTICVRLRPVATVCASPASRNRRGARREAPLGGGEGGAVRHGEIVRRVAPAAAPLDWRLPE